jgi:class 3 adenylate cyclase/tetratricopeptide (TPR) repeat protein
MTVGRVVERRIVTVLFADLVGFTALSERLDAEDVSLVQDAYFDAVRETIGRHGGVLEKFIGDAAMAVFGAPRVRDDDAERAVRAGLALVAAVERLGGSLGLESDVLRLRVGINSGESLFAEATAERGPVTGDAVNVAARLQAAADPGSVVVGELTRLAVADAVELEPMAPLELKGKSQPVPAWRAIGVFPERSRERALGDLRAPTLGREEEMSRLLGALGDGARRVVVVAPPGVGKTRLLESVGAAAGQTGAAVLRARLRPDLLAPFEPVGQLVRAALAGDDLAIRLRRADVAGDRAAAIEEALTAVLSPAASPAGTGASDERDRRFRAWLDGIDALTRDGPAVWLVEDVHWASGDLLAFLDLAGRAPSAAGRLVIASSRPVVLESAAPWCAGGELLDLPLLPPAETAELVRALVGDALPPELVDRIADRSGGNALFVEELLRTWTSVGVLARDDGDGWRLVTPAGEVPLPATVQAIYAGQLDDLPGPARSAARRAAVAGRRFPSAALGVLGVESPDEALATLTRRALLSGPEGDAALGESYAYRHALLRDAGYASLARTDRALLHVRLADWLAALAADAQPAAAEVVARHYAAALENAPALVQEIDGRPRAALAELAGDWFDRAAEVAFEFAAWDSARALAARALELTAGDRLLDRARRLHRLANATANAIGIEEASVLLNDALEAYRAAAADDEGAARTGLASVGSSLGYLLRAQTRFDEAEKLANELLSEISGPPEDVSTGRLLALRGVAALNARDDYDAARKDADRALELARGGGDAPFELEALQLVAQVEAERGTDNRDDWAEIEELARRLGRWETVARASWTRAGFVLEEDPAAAVRVLERTAEICTARGLVEMGGWIDHLRAEAHFLAGCWDDALDAGLRAFAVGEAHDFHRVVVRSWFVLLPIARARGRDDLVRQAFVRFDARRGKEPTSPYARIVATAAHLHFAAVGLEPAFVPDLEERLPSFDMAHGDPSWLSAIETVVDSWLGAGEHAAAEQALDRMRARLDGGTVSALANATERILRARLLTATGRDGAAAAADQALAELGASAPWWRAHAIRELEAAGRAPAALVAEAAAIEHRLGVTQPL